ncbi:MAG TPA: hypothetical protein VIQ80_02420 [Candidatus Saccharimonadales bacterium]
MKLNLSMQSIKKAVIGSLHRFHIVMFVVIVLGGLAMVILLLNNVAVRSSQSDGYTPDTNNTSFDQATIKRIQDLKSTGQSSGQLPTGVRTNPFVE